MLTLQNCANARILSVPGIPPVTPENPMNRPTHWHVCESPATYRWRRSVQDPWCELSGREFSEWWDDPEEWRGSRVVTIGGERVRWDFAAGSVPTITGRLSHLFGKENE